MIENAVQDFMRKSGVLTLEERLFILEVDPSYIIKVYPNFYVERLQVIYGGGSIALKDMMMKEYEEWGNKYDSIDADELKRNPPEHIKGALNAFRNL